MARAAFLTFLNEFRLLAKDRVGLFMLLLAPLVIIAVAGFSLGNIYGARPGPQAYVIPLVNQDHGAIGEAIVKRLRRDPSITLELSDDPARASGVVRGRERQPLAIVIPAGTTAALRHGQTAHLVLYVDPVKRLEVSAVELQLDELCRQVTAGVRAQAGRELAARLAARQAQLRHLAVQVRQLHSQIEDFQGRFDRRRARAQIALRTQLRKLIADTQRQTQTVTDRSLAQARSALQRAAATRGQALAEVELYLGAVQSSQAAFERWFAILKAAAGSHALEIPPPPAFPAPPSTGQLAILAKPIALATAARAQLPPPTPAIRLPWLPPLPDFRLSAGVSAPSVGPLTLPGALAWRERATSAGAASAFDQYVPGFGITFLMIGMLMGIGLGLIDEREWGTLQRLRVSGAPLVSVLVGKLASRFLIGLVQMILLFVLGWWLFAISLGTKPAVLLLPTAAICFAAATFGLVIACVARTHDSVMPIGAVLAMAMSAIGGCWWPLDFEPAWMRDVAKWLPTTWAMQAYNDLMIRHLNAASVLWPSAAAAGLGVLYLVAGIIGASWLYE